MRDKFAELIRAGAESEGVAGLPAVSPDLERRVMIEVARRALARSRARARRGMVASLAGLAMLLVGCLAALVVWFPALMPALADFSWFEELWDLIPGLDAATATTLAAEADGAAAPFLEQWGGPILLMLLVAAVGGGVYYINSLFSSEFISD